VVPLDISGIVLGSPYLYDMKEIFYREDNKYQLTKYGKEYIVRDHLKKLNLSLIKLGKMKRIVNVSKRYLVMVVKAKNTIGIDTFKDCDMNLKDDLVRIVSYYDEIFQVPKVLPLKRQVEHGIQLQQDVPLLNIGMYRLSVLENAEIKK
jgi:hypothetical protein